MPRWVSRRPCRLGSGWYWSRTESTQPGAESQGSHLPAVWPQLVPSPRVSVSWRAAQSLQQACVRALGVRGLEQAWF